MATRAASAASLVTMAADGIAGFADGPDPIENQDVDCLGQSISYLGVASKILSPVAARKVFGDGVTPEQSEKVGVGVDAVLAFLALTPAVYHLQELSSAPSGAPRSSAIVSKTAAIVSSIGGITAFFAAIDEDPDSKALLAAAVGVLSLLYGGLQFGIAAINPHSSNLQRASPPDRGLLPA